jgi:hypothetical protein
MTEEFDKNTWKNRHYWSQDYDGVSEPKDEKEELTRNAETVRDSLLGKPEDEWNQGTHGWHNADYTDDQHAQAWEHTDVDKPIDENVYNAMLEMDKKLKEGTYDPNEN